MMTSNVKDNTGVKSSAAKMSLEEKLKLVPLDRAVFERDVTRVPSAPRTARSANSDKPSRKKLALFASVAALGACAALYWSFGADPAAQAPGAAKPAVSAAVPAAPSPAAVTSALTASGYVVARRQATVAAQITGQVRSILVSEGIKVSAGQLIARMDSSAMTSMVASASARRSGSFAQISGIDAELVAARATLGRYEELSVRGFTTRKDLEAARAQVAVLESRRAQANAEVSAAAADLQGARVQADQFNIYAPFAGTVIAINAQEGEIVSPVSSGGGFTRTGICTIVDMDSLELEVDVAEAHIARVAAGDPVEIALSAYPDVSYRGRVITVVPIADRSKASFKVRIEVLNRDERMLPEMVANVRFLKTQKR
jgi:HlyD family secretion protein